MKSLAWTGIVAAITALWALGAPLGLYVLTVIGWCIAMAMIDRRTGFVASYEEPTVGDAATAPTSPPVTIIRERIQYRAPSNAGLVAGILGCVFAVLGIFTLGLIFVPIAFLCSLAGLLRAAAGMSATGGAAAALAMVLTAVAAATSPSVWIAAALLIGTGAGH